MIPHARDINLRFQTRPPVERKMYATGVSWPIRSKLCRFLLLRSLMVSEEVNLPVSRIWKERWICPIPT
jgi:hypothetical protein